MKKILILAVALLVLSACTTPVHVEMTATVESIQQNTTRHSTLYRVRACHNRYQYIYVYTDSLYQPGDKITIH